MVFHAVWILTTRCCRVLHTVSNSINIVVFVLFFNDFLKWNSVFASFHAASSNVFSASLVQHFPLSLEPTSTSSIVSTPTFGSLCVVPHLLYSCFMFPASLFLHSLHLYPFHPSFHTLPPSSLNQFNFFSFLFFFVRCMIHGFSARTDA